MSEWQPGRDSPQEEQRESIWSVSPGLLWLYLILFGLLFVFGTAYLVYYENTQPPTGSGHDVAAAVIKSIGSVAIGSAGLSFFATELTGGTMVLASYLKRKLLDEPERARKARERKLAEQNDEIARLSEENARLREENELRGEIVRLRQENARLNEENTRLREKNGQPLNQDSSKPEKD